VLAGETYNPGKWEDIGLHCSGTERRADEATRDVDNWLKCFYMKERIGEEFHGTIAGVAAFGIFVALDEVFVEGMVHVSELGEDYFHFEPAKHQMLGERTGKRFRLGDRLRVKLVRADLETGRIDFILVQEQGKGAPGGDDEVVTWRKGNAGKPLVQPPPAPGAGGKKPRPAKGAGNAGFAKAGGSGKGAGGGGGNGGSGGSGKSHASKPAAKQGGRPGGKGGPKGHAKGGKAAGSRRGR